MPIEDADYFIHVLPFPVSIPAFIRLFPDGTFGIYLNANMPEKWLDGWEHELWHIINDDFFNDKPIEEIENLK